MAPSTAWAAGASVGFEAKGVDPAAALNNPLGLDVRDALGRRVSAAKVMRDLGRAQARRSRESSYGEALPGAGRLSALGGLRAFLRAALIEPFGESAPAVWSRALTSRPGDKFARLIVLFFGVLLLRRFESCRRFKRAFAFRPLFVLRC